MAGNFGVGVLGLFDGINEFYLDNYGLGYLDNSGDQVYGGRSAGEMLGAVVVLLVILLVMLSQGVITFNTLYLTIHRLQDFGYVEEQGKVVSEDNRARIYFAITPEGEEYLNALIREYRRYTGAVDQILGLTEGGKGA